MLALRPSCENCAKALPPDSVEAMICSFECTFCAGCVDSVLSNVCPNCGGGFERRPVRPRSALRKNPAVTTETLKPVEPAVAQRMRDKFEHIPPAQR
ncbi:hypothetical protein CH352_17395 [Leptospira hartskeerlii]|uniref:Urease n=2 Tax=Leptospira hartskeerlii TaxID=2023177 RepID=A0A2M9XCV6_9LEPT|nr:DUF1272 domain-containing protein [Leptospira hartskeerlii]PJZ25541.1 hypothetical protein CH357_11570 [Leptospira hartskeerlii]PJZ32181.1 hypothetical protein CH352_17395 [Leptospira hartskeerlii]